MTDATRREVRGLCDALARLAQAGAMDERMLWRAVDVAWLVARECHAEACGGSKQHATGRGGYVASSVT